MADTDRAEKPMDDRPGQLPEPKEAGAGEAGMGKEHGPEPKTPATNEEE